MQPEQLSRIGKTLFDMIEFDQDEQLVDEIHKHPFGLFIIYLTGFSIGFIAFLVLILLPAMFGGDSSSLGFDLTKAQPIMTVLAFFFFIATFIGTFIGAYLYKNDVILVTSEKLAQILYKTIFNRKISQLSIGDVQDVTVNQVGIFPRIFNYGTIVIETAGEQNNYQFTYVPNPYKRAKNIVGSQEVNLRKFGN